MVNDIKVGASILAADFANLKNDIENVQKANIDFLHIDVMDGHFVKNITMGPCVVNSINKVNSLPQYVHLMIENPGEFIKPFVEAGADMITFHLETVDKSDVLNLVKEIKDLNCMAGIAINPDTPIELVYPYLEDIDLILVMSVYPGFSGQKFIKDILPKIESLRVKYKGLIEVDGGINAETGKLAFEVGANVLVAASYIFKSDNINMAVKSLKNVRGDG